VKRHCEPFNGACGVAPGKLGEAMQMQVLDCRVASGSSQ